MRVTKRWIIPLTFLLLLGCSEEDRILDDFFYLKNEGADLPVYVQGDVTSGVFIILLHGGPGGSAHMYNSGSLDFARQLEDSYAMVYYDQRGSGVSKGKYPKSKLTVEQHVNDLHVLIQLIKKRYGNRISLFLMGHSWGGTLGTAYLLNDEYEQEISGWIEVSGAHNYYGVPELVENFEQVAREQLYRENSESFWNEILDYISTIDLENVTDEQLSKLNNYGYEAETKLVEDEQIRYEGTKLSRPEILLSIIDFYFFSGYDFVQGNINSLITSSQLGMFDEIRNLDYTSELYKINLPTLMVWGEYDMVVPVELGKQGYRNLGTSTRQKTMIIVKQAGHSVMMSHSYLVVDQMRTFVNGYK